MQIRSQLKAIFLFSTLATALPTFADALPEPDGSPVGCEQRVSEVSIAAPSSIIALTYISTFPPSEVQASIEATKGCESNLQSVSPNSLTGGWSYEITADESSEIIPYISCFDVGPAETLCYGSPSSSWLNLSYSWSITGDLQHTDYAHFGLPRMAGITCISGGSGGVLTLHIQDNVTGAQVETSKQVKCTAL